uniref:Uncharacterized protein n=1 Tax=Magallana gigas TaxID=29159 RepID=K1PZN8_MAGGI
MEGAWTTSHFLRAISSCYSPTVNTESLIILLKFWGSGNGSLYTENVQVQGHSCLTMQLIKMISMPKTNFMYRAKLMKKKKEEEEEEEDNA